MMFIDTHAHVNKNMYENISQIVNDAKNNNVLKIVNAAENIFTSNEVVKLSLEYKDVLYAAVGIHPLNMEEVGSEDILKLEEIVKNNKVVAIGEIGLDYHYSKDNKELQKFYFRKQLDLATKYNLPVIIHSRDATQDTIDILKEYKLNGVIHCFSGSLEIANEYIKMGFFLGIGGVLTFKNANLKEILINVPLEKILLETDSPFLTPEPYRKYRNEPKYIPIIAEFLSRIKEVSLEDVKKITSENANKIFDF